MAIHALPHNLAGRRACVSSGHYEGELVDVVDWFDRVVGLAWTEACDDPRVWQYGHRCGCRRLPLDYEVIAARLGSDELLIHQSELIAPLFCEDLFRVGGELVEVRS